MKHITEFKIFESLGTDATVGPVVQCVMDILRKNDVKFTDDSTKVQQKNATVNLVVECAPKDLYKIITSVELRDKFNSDELLKRRVALVTKLNPSIWTATMKDRQGRGVNFFIYNKTGRMTFGFNNNPDASTALKYTKEDDPKEVAASIFTKFINRNIYQVFYRVVETIEKIPSVSDELIDDVLKTKYNDWNKMLLANPKLTVPQFNRVIRVMLSNKENDWTVGDILKKLKRAKDIEKKTIDSILSKELRHTIDELQEEGIAVDVESLLKLVNSKDSYISGQAKERLRNTDVLGDLLGE